MNFAGETLKTQNISQGGDVDCTDPQARIDFVVDALGGAEDLAAVPSKLDQGLARSPQSSS